MQEFYICADVTLHPEHLNPQPYSLKPETRNLNPRLELRTFGPKYFYGPVKSTHPAVPFNLGFRDKAHPFSCNCKETKISCRFKEWSIGLFGNCP